MAHTSHLVLPDFKKFFSDRARAFVEGKFDTVIDALTIPTSVYVLGQMIVINAKQDAIAALQIYKTNLLATRYAATRTSVLDVSEADAGKVRVRTVTAHFDGQGTELSSFEVLYFIRLMDRPEDAAADAQASDAQVSDAQVSDAQTYEAPAFSIELIETLTPGDTRLTEGLPLL